MLFLFFSNENIPGVKTFPFLSNPISAFDPVRVYEQGELVQFGINDIRVFYLDDTGTNSWITIPAGNYVNENDCVLVPVSFGYYFRSTDNVTQAEFTLKDNSGNIIQVIKSKSNTDVLGKVTLNFDSRAVNSLPLNKVNDSVLYTLEVAGNNSYNKISRLIFFHNNSDFRNAICLVNIRPAVTDNAFNLLDASGLLITQRNPDNSIFIQSPVFEIWMKSRLAFWRYIHDQGGVLKNGIHPDFLLFDNGRLISKKPRSQTYIPTLYIKPPANTLHYLPNPFPFKECNPENRRLYIDIMVPASDIFPLGP